MIVFLAPLAAWCGDDAVRLFPLEAHRGLRAPWLETLDETRLFSQAWQDRGTAAYQRLWLAPWDPAQVQARLTPALAALESRQLAKLQLGIDRGEGFGPNFHPRGQGWLTALRRQVPAVSGEAFRFQPGRRAITTDNLPVRLLPTADPYYQSHRLPGQGYPFDDLQNSVLWAGTPVYVLGESRDRAWSKVLAPCCAGWVRSQGLGLAAEGFVRQWQRAVRQRGLVAVIATATPVVDEGGTFRFQAFVGSVYPQGPARGGAWSILIPIRRDASGEAVGATASLAGDAGVRQPWPYTPRNAAWLWQTLLGRPYGWGNLDGLNDCSAELKQFFTPFGLWLPRNSAAPKDIGPATDLSALDLPARMEAIHRLARPYRTLLWIEGHVMLYLGPLPPGAGAGETGFMTYQNLWGLRPKEPPDYRSVVGGSVLFPVYGTHPEAPELFSLAGRKRLVLTQLDGERAPAAPSP